MSLPGVLCSSAALRLALVAIPGLTTHLSSYVELATSISSFVRMQEGVFLYAQGAMPYAGPVHQSPLLLSLFSMFGSWYDVVYLAADTLAAWQLSVYASHTNSFAPAAVAAFYLFNPFSVLSALARSTNVFSNALICASLGAAAGKRPVQAMMFLALASVLSYYPLYLVLGLMGVCRKFTSVSLQKLTVSFIGSVAVFLGLAYLPLQSWSFLSAQYGTQILLLDLTSPNIGLWWYFFIELFEFFRPFFLGAFQLFLLSYPVPFAIRFSRHPLYAMTAVAGVLAVFKPYPEASDLGLYLSLLVLDKPVFGLLEYRAFEALGLLYVSVLSPTFYYLWIYCGSGNANFYYAITLVYALTMIMLFADSIWAAIRLDHDGGKSKTLTQL